jgi:hypothetical protein
MSIWEFNTWPICGLIEAKEHYRRLSELGLDFADPDAVGALIMEVERRLNPDVTDENEDNREPYQHYGD